MRKNTGQENCEYRHFLHSASPLQQPKAVVFRCSIKKVFSNISQISCENTCYGVFLLVRLQAKLAILMKKFMTGRMIKQTTSL